MTPSSSHNLQLQVLEHGQKVLYGRLRLGLEFFLLIFGQVLDNLVEPWLHGGGESAHLGAAEHASSDTQPPAQRQVYRSDRHLEKTTPKRVPAPLWCLEHTVGNTLTDLIPTHQQQLAWHAQLLDRSLFTMLDQQHGKYGRQQCYRQAQLGVKCMSICTRWPAAGIVRMALRKKNMFARKWYEGRPSCDLTSTIYETR